MATKGRKRTNKTQSISIENLVDDRISGDSFDSLAEKYHLTKMEIYGYYKSYAPSFCGYDPLDKNRIEKYLKNKKLFFSDVAAMTGVSPAGLKNYIHDRKIKGRKPHATRVKWLIEHGFTLNGMARFYGLSFNAMRAWLQGRGLEKND